MIQPHYQTIRVSERLPNTEAQYREWNFEWAIVTLADGAMDSQGVTQCVNVMMNPSLCGLLKLYMWQIRQSRLCFTFSHMCSDGASAVLFFSKKINKKEKIV